MSTRPEPQRCPAPLCLLLLTHGGMDCWCRKRKKAAK